MSGLCRVFYCSRSLLNGSRADIEVKVRRILATARVANRKANLTGALTFNENCFAQVLEGEPANLTPVFDRIRRDPRHCELKILERANVAQRLFPLWSMAYVEPTGGDGNHPLAHFSFESALTEGATPQAQKLLDALCRVVVVRGAS